MAWAPSQVPYRAGGFQASSATGWGGMATLLQSQYTIILNSAACCDTPRCRAYAGPVTRTRLLGPCWLAVPNGGHERARLSHLLAAQGAPDPENPVKSCGPPNKPVIKTQRATKDVFVCHTYPQKTLENPFCAGKHIL